MKVLRLIISVVAIGIFFGLMGFDLAYQPYFVPFELHINPRTHQVEIRPSINIPFPGGQITLQYEGPFYGEDNIPNAPQDNTLRILIQDVYTYTIHSVDLSETNVSLRVNGRDVGMGELVITSGNYVIFFSEDGCPLVSFHKGYLWINAANGSVEDVTLVATQQSLVRNILVSTDSNMLLCRSTLETNHGAPFFVCLAEGTEFIINLIPNHIALLFGNFGQAWIPVGRVIGFCLYYFLLIYLIFIAVKTDNLYATIALVSISCYFLVMGLGIIPYILHH